MCSIRKENVKKCKSDDELIVRIIIRIFGIEEIIKTLLTIMNCSGILI